MHDVTPPPGDTHVLTRQTVLDGIRGVAIFMVLLVHFWPDYLMPDRVQEWGKKVIHAGWVGVDLFFVLSGFLVTGILLRVQQTPGWVRSFYARRALRILPLYLGTLAIVFGLLPWLVPPEPAFSALQQRQGWFWLHGANLAAWGGDFARLESATVSLGHLWSLAVEEHFYLLWPVLVWCLPRRRLPWALGGVVVGAMVFRCAMLLTQPPELLNGLMIQTPARLDGMALGALLALAVERAPKWQLRRWAWVGWVVSGLLLVGEFGLRKGLGPGSPFIRSVGFTLLGVFFAAGLALLLSGTRRSWVYRGVDQPWWHFFGKYSYGLYVIHGCLRPAMGRWLPPEWFLAYLRWPWLAALGCFTAKTGICVGLALISWRCLEAPCLRLKERFEYAKRLRAWPGGTSEGR